MKLSDILVDLQEPHEGTENSDPDGVSHNLADVMEEVVQGAFSHASAACASSGGTG